jgi:prolyl oligopeptidase
VTAAARAAVVLSVALIAATGDGAAPVRPQTDTYFGTAIVDPYRYMERDDPAYRQWKAQQRQATNAMLTMARSRAPQFSKSSQSAARITDLALAGDRVFYVRHTATNDALMVCDVHACQPRTIVTAATYGSLTLASLGAFAASSDGNTIALHVYVGNAISDIHFLRVTDGHDVDPPLHNSVFDYIGFFPDNRGVVYARAIGSGHDALTGRFLDYAHRFGTPQRADVAIFGSGVSKRVRVPENAFAFVDPHERYAIAEVRDYSAIGSRFYAAPTATVGRPNTPWRLLGGADAQYTDYAVRDTTIDLITHKNAPNYAVVRASLSGPFLPHVVLPASNDTVVSGTLDYVPKAGIFALNAARDADYVQLLHGGHAQMVRIPYDDGSSPQTTMLPLEGSVLAAAVDPARDGVLLQMTSWTDPGDVYQVRKEGLWSPLHIVDPDGNAGRHVIEITATASDGTEIPVDLILPARAPEGPNHSDYYVPPAPTIVISSGAFGFSITPDYRIVPQAWLDAGGIVAVAHIRGGGEFGEDWHRAGMGANKSNSWNDLIAVGQFLVRNPISSRLDLLGTTQSYLGGTASSIAIGRAIEERPDLFSAAVIDSPSFDMLRAETIPFGQQSVPEFGSVTNRGGFAALLAMSPYAHVRDGATYPPILVRSFQHYLIGADWQAAKMVARWQAATNRPGSAYLDIVGDSSADTRTQADLREDALAFFSYENSRANTSP